VYQEKKTNKLWTSLTQSAIVSENRYKTVGAILFHHQTGSLVKCMR